MHGSWKSFELIETTPNLFRSPAAMILSKRSRWLSLAIFLASGVSALAAEGRHKIVVMAFGEDEFAIVDISKDMSKLVSVQDRLFPKATIGSVTEKDGLITVELKTAVGADSFQGKTGKDGKIRGVFKLRGAPYAAELVPTKAEKVAELSSGKVQQEVMTVLRDNAQKDMKTRAGALKTLVEKYADKPYASSIYAQYLSLADQAELTESDIKKTLDQWFSTAKEYSDTLYDQARSNAVRALRGKKKAAAGVLLNLAQDLDKSLSEENDLETKTEIAAVLADTARTLGKTDLADSVDKKLKGYEGKLDENYAKKVPPFKPEKVAEKKDSRPVVMELFTGAQCPPCVAADVGFDALGDTYSHSNVILLQYHLHIPGPDPLTNDDSVTRQKYYGTDVQGTPSTFFNGKSDGGGGGSMAGSEGKYKEFRSIIDSTLAGKPSATVDLKASRKGDTIEISTKAKTAQKPGEKAKPRLRMVITEEVVKYVGSNKLRFHHHVVRDMPGGADGVSLDKAGELTHSAKVDVKALRGEIEKYISDFEKSRPFFGVKPAIDLKKLSVVAFVQDDESKEILGAASVDVAETP